MEIITKRHWLGFNSHDREESDWAVKSSGENFKIYTERLEKLRERLNKRNWEFFRNGLHDSRLVSFSVGDGLHIDFENGPPVNITDFYKTSVRSNY